jgi:uncharacterized protein involved in propanediol utilization
MITTLTGTARAPGTCGELLQGQFHPAEDFLVTLPVDIWSQVQVEIYPGPPTVTSTPPHKTKTRQAVRKTLDLYGRVQFGAHVNVDSALAEGKGLASSTADITAACLATARAVGVSISPEQISAIAGQIEPSDGIMYPGVVCYNHRTCRLIETLGTPPPLQALIVDPGGCVDTVAFNRLPKRYTADEMTALAAAYDTLKTGLRTGDMSRIGKAATISARINQRFLYNPLLESLVAIGREHRAYGVCVAHSGTVAGILFGAQAGDAVEQAIAAIQARIGPGIKMITTTTPGNDHYP